MPDSLTGSVNELLVRGGLIPAPRPSEVAGRNMSLLTSVGAAVGPTPATVPGNLPTVTGNIGALIGRAIAPGATGDAIGTILGTVAGTVLEGSGVLPGRAQTPVTGATGFVPAVVGQAGRAMISGGMGAMMLRFGRGIAKQAAQLVPLVGVEIASQVLGLSISDTAVAAVKGRRRRRRGISAADIRRTYRTLNTVARIQSKLSGARICRKRR